MEKVTQMNRETEREYRLKGRHPDWYKMIFLILASNEYLIDYYRRG